MPTGLRAMPVLPVTEVERSATALARALGFAIAGYWRDADGEARFAVLRLGTVTLALRRVAEVAPSDGWAACIFVDDAAAVAELARAGGFAVSGPSDRPYACRETEVTDRDGNILCFSEDLKPGPEGPGL
jgi:hypothetical protein